MSDSPEHHLRLHGLGMRLPDWLVNHVVMAYHYPYQASGPGW
jgi:hypothetical protein